MTPRRYLEDLVRMVCAERTRSGPDALVRALATRQHGVVARWELLALGLSRDTIGRRVRSGQLVRVYPGVYAVGHAVLTLNGRRMAAVLAAGPDAALSHRDAAALHRLRTGGGARFDVTTTGAVRDVRGLSVFRTATWPPGHVTVVDGIPVTTVCRTIADLAGVLTDQALDSVLARTEFEQYDTTDLDAVVAALRGRRGSGPARLGAARERFAVLGAVLTRSEGEILLREVLARHGLPEALMNHPVSGDEVDAIWPDVQAGIELDSWKFHRGRVRFVRDRAKLRRLTLAGYAILPFSGSDLVHDPAGLAAQAAALLRSRSDRVR
jgi:hypothetical protein